MMNRWLPSAHINMTYPLFHVIWKLHVMRKFLLASNFHFFSLTMDSSLNSKDIVCWDFEIFVIWVVSRWLGWFYSFWARFSTLCWCAATGQPFYIFTPAPGHMYWLTLKFMVQIVKKLIVTKPDPLNSMSEKIPNYVQFRKMHKFRTTLTQAKTRCDNSKTTLNMLI